MRPIQTPSVTDQPRGRGRPRAGHIKVTISLEPRQVEALQRAAFERAKEAGSLKPDASAIVREALDAWLKKQG